MQIEITDMEHITSNGGVVVVHWQAVKHEGEFEAKVSGKEVFHPDPESPSFVPFEQLVEADVVDWLVNRANWADRVGTWLDLQMIRVQNPPIVRGLPWAE